MAIEIERKFLVKGDFKQMATSSIKMKQGYICSQKGRTVRVRIAGEKAYLTIKGPSKDGGLSRNEFEKEITYDEGLSLFMLCEPGIVDKTRWIVPYEGHIFEVDEFHGENDGLIVAEVELNEVTESFEKPDFLGDEVTDDPKYRNSSLRALPYNKWTEV